MRAKYLRLASLIAIALLSLQAFAPNYAHSCGAATVVAAGDVEHAAHGATHDGMKGGAPAEHEECECTPLCCAPPAVVVVPAVPTLRVSVVTVDEVRPTVLRQVVVVARHDVRLPFATAPPVV